MKHKLTLWGRRGRQAEALLEYLRRITAPGARRDDPVIHGAAHDFLCNIGHNQRWVDIAEGSRPEAEK